jgi:hypothetical protein
MQSGGGDDGDATLLQWRAGDKRRFAEIRQFVDFVEVMLSFPIGQVA